ncbi:MAG: CD225/dispanin family protein [Candidatus Sulfotelmatobacter sp.]
MFCSQCGANNADNAAVCMQCGRSLQAGPPAVPLQPVQPAGVVLPPGVGVQNYLVFAILVTVLCCLPAGIPAIVYAAQVNGKLQAGDVAGAQLASKNAKMWCLISAGLGLAVGLIYAVLVMVGILSGIHSN